jgi:predicted HTH transcriptional regulator
MNESEHIEFKKSLSEQKEGLISLAAILNKHGQGELWFGVRNDGTPEGLRVSDADCKLSVSELERLILEKNRTHRSWDTEASTLPLKGLYKDGITLENLRDGTVSRRRNPLIAELLRRINFVESWGRGIPLILEKEPSASFAVKGGWFVTTLLRTSKTSGKTSDVSGKTSDVSVKTPDVSVEIIQAIQSDDRITIPQLAALAGVATRTIERRLKKLQQSGRLRRVGPDKGGHWQVLDL